MMAAIGLIGKIIIVLMFMLIYRYMGFEYTAILLLANLFANELFKDNK
jgi:hypothetical protein